MPKKPILDNRLDLIRHSLAHVMAAAVQKIYGQTVKFAIGPTIDNGFYYDIDFASPAVARKAKAGTVPIDLPKIEKEMQQLLMQKIDFIKETTDLATAKKLFKNDPYKLELIKDLEQQGTTKKTKSPSPKIPKTSKVTKAPKITIYKTGSFTDLCRGPHVANTKELLSAGFKLTKLAGAYWRGDEKNKMLTRIYGVAFATKDELKAYLQQMAEAERRDHRKLGKELELFSFHDEGPGLAFWHDKGLTLRNELIKFWRAEHLAAGYTEVSTPIILNESLWQTSGHMKNYKENMYFTEIDAQRFAIKPMNCPGGLLLYKERPHSYRELPMRVAELGLVHRHERAGVLHGLFRVRSFTQDDAHIYCAPNQIVDELKGVVRLTQKIYQAFGFEYHLEISTRPKKFIGDIKVWNKAEATLKKVLNELKLPYKINEGDGAFYGPKIDYHIKDSIGRTWQCGTLQLDFAQPQNFKLEYIDEKGHAKRPVMLHRTIYGSLERFIGILIEHYAGAFPFWLAPVQVAIIPVGEAHLEPCQTLKQTMIELYQDKAEPGQSNVRITIDESAESVGYKIRQAAKQKIPYTIVIGDKEITKDQTWPADTKLTVRKFGQSDTKEILLKKFVHHLTNELK